MAQKTPPRPEEFPDQVPPGTRGEGAGPRVKPSGITTTSSLNPNKPQPKPEEFPDQGPKKLWDPAYLREPTTTEKWVSGAARVGLPVGVGLASSATMSPLAGIGLGGASAAIGEGLAQAYEIEKGIRKSFSLSEATVQAIAGAVPLLSKYPGSNAGIKRLIAHVTRAGAEGALVNAASEIPLHVAQSGKVEWPSAGQVGTSAGIGFAFGSGLGGAHTAYRQMADGNPYSSGGLAFPGISDKPSSPDWRTTQQNIPQTTSGQMNLPIGPALRQSEIPFPPRNPPTGPSDSGGGGLIQGDLFNPSRQQELNFANFDEAKSTPESMVTPEVLQNLKQYGVQEVGRQGGRAYFGGESDLGLENLRTQTPDAISPIPTIPDTSTGNLFNTNTPDQQGSLNLGPGESVSNRFQLANNRPLFPRTSSESAQTSAESPQTGIRTPEELGLPNDEINGFSFPDADVTPRFRQDMLELGYQPVERRQGHTVFKKIEDSSDDIAFQRSSDGGGNIPPEWSQNQVIQPPSVQQTPGLEGAGPLPTQPRNIVPGMEIPQKASGLDVDRLRQQNLFPSGSVTPKGPYASGPNDVSASFPEGQLELPWTRGENPLIHDADARMREQAAIANRFKQPFDKQPEQLSMEDQMKDAEIMDFLQREDETPPEMKDLSTYGPEQMDPTRDEPSFAKIEGGGLTASVDIRRAVENITKDYTSPLPGIMSREGMQNALDATEALGGNGDVKIRMAGDTIEIYDNGKGLDEDQLANKLVEIFATGKEGEAGATGGKGIGSASYIYGGQYFRIETVAVDAKDGLKYRIIASGTPDQFLDPVRGSDFERVQVDSRTPTGTTIEVQLKDDHYITDAREMVDRIVNNSRNRSSRVVVDKKGASIGTPLKDVEPNDEYITEHRIPVSGYDTLIGDFTTSNRNSKIEVLIPTYNPSTTGSEFEVHYLNNGMYQFSETIYLGKQADGVPDKVLVDIHPLVDDQNELYPFINTREDIKKDIREEISKFIADNISKPGINKRKNRIQELYDSMSPVSVTGTNRRPIIFDPGNRLTPEEMEDLVTSPVIGQLIQTYDALINNILSSVSRSKWINRLEGVGLVLDPNMHGVHIPNPDTDKSTILINPFIRIGDKSLSPKEVAWRNTITNLHEVAHIGGEHSMQFRLTPEDLQDPRVGEFLSSYMNQIVEHGDISMWTDTGHGMGFAHRLGEVYAKFGVDATYTAAENIHTILTGGSKSGGYSPEVQRLLQLYTESRGRAATTEDLLSGTGVKQADRGSGGEGDIPGNRPPNGDGTFGNDPIDPTGPGKKRKDQSLLQKMYNLPRGLTTTMDISAPLRQGLGLVYRKEWWKSWNQLAKALGNEDAYRKALGDIKKRPLFQNKIVLENGKPVLKPSWAEKAGMKMMELDESPNSREEAVSTSWAETGEFLGKNVVQRGYKATVGRSVRASNRAYTAFLNQLRADTFESLVEDAKRLYLADKAAGITDGSNKNPMVDLPFASEIADMVNTATGRGPLKYARPTIKDGKVGLKESDFEQHAELVTNVLFSPRLFASRMRMLNPATYMMASPFVRKQYLKSFLATMGAWGAVSALAKGMGAEVSTDTNSADFGKIRIGNTRLDPAGGFQQYLVAGSRFLTGYRTPSTGGESTELGAGFRAETRGDVIHRFGANKLAPVAKFAHDLFYASQRTPFQVGDRTIQMFVPLIIQDVLELAQEDPKLLPLIAPIATGMGTQTYDKGEAKGRFIDPENDLTFEGGNPFESIF